MKTLPLKLFLCSLIGLLTFGSCLKDNDDYQHFPAGFMIHVNAFPEDNALYYYIDGRGINNNIAPIAFKSYASTNLFTGQRNYKVVGMNETKALIDSTITVKDSTAYTSFVFGTKEKPKFGLTIDKGIKDLGDKSGIRYFNLANNVEETNLFIGTAETALFSKRATETGASIVQYQAFQANASGNLPLIIKDNAGKELAKRDYNFVKGQYYTIILTGVKDNTQTPLYIGVVAIP